MNSKGTVAVGVLAVGISVLVLLAMMYVGRASEPWERGMYSCRHLGVAHWCQNKDDDTVVFYMRTFMGLDGPVVQTLSREDARNSAD